MLGSSCARWPRLATIGSAGTACEIENDTSVIPMHTGIMSKSRRAMKAKMFMRLALDRQGRGASTTPRPGTALALAHQAEVALLVEGRVHVSGDALVEHDDVL